MQTFQVLAERTAQVVAAQRPWLSKGTGCRQQLVDDVVVFGSLENQRGECRGLARIEWMIECYGGQAIYRVKVALRGAEDRRVRRGKRIKKAPTEPAGYIIERG